MVRTERDQSEMPGALDGRGHRALVLGADPGLSARLYLPPVGHVPAKAVNIFVINVFDTVNAEAANLPATVIARPAASESAARPAAGTVSTTGSASATRTVATATGPAASAGTVSAATGSAASAGTIAALLSAGPATAARAIAAALRAARSRTLARWS